MQDVALLLTIADLQQDVVDDPAPPYRLALPGLHDGVRHLARPGLQGHPDRRAVAGDILDP